MPIYTQTSPAKLRRRLQEVLGAIEAAEPGLYAEMVLLQKLLQAAESGTEKLFAEVTSRIGAIELCLDLAGDWLTKQQIYDMMAEGGYPMKPNTGRGLLNDALNYHVETKRIARKGDLFGRPAWLLRSSQGIPNI